MEFETSLKVDLQRKLISPKILLGNLRVSDERVRSLPIYQDPTYFPFYYHLGKYLTPKSILVFGFGVGLSISCFLKTNKSTKNVLAFEPNSKDYYSPRLGLSNVKDSFMGQIDFHRGSLLDERLQNQWDLILFDFDAGYDDLRNCLDYLWENLNLDGHIVIDRNQTAKKAVDDFILGTNRTAISFPTRNQITILKK